MQIYGGVKFARLLKSTVNVRDDQHTNEMFERLLKFLVELSLQLQKRLPLNDSTLLGVSSLLDPACLVGSGVTSIF